MLKIDATLISAKYDAAGQLILGKELKKKHISQDVRKDTHFFNVTQSLLATDLVVLQYKTCSSNNMQYITAFQKNFWLSKEPAKMDLELQ